MCTPADPFFEIVSDIDPEYQSFARDFLQDLLGNEKELVSIIPQPREPKASCNQMAIMKLCAGIHGQSLSLLKKCNLDDDSKEALEFVCGIAQDVIDLKRILGSELGEELTRTLVEHLNQIHLVLTRWDSRGQMKKMLNSKPLVKKLEVYTAVIKEERQNIAFRLTKKNAEDLSLHTSAQSSELAGCKSMILQLMAKMEEKEAKEKEDALVKEKTEEEKKIYSASLLKAMDETIPSRELQAKVLKDAEKLEKQGSYDEALVRYLKYRKLLRQQGESDTIEDLSTADMFHTIGNAHFNRGLYPDAMKFFEKELEMRQKLVPAGHISYSSTHIGIANVFNEQGKHSDALNYYNKALKLRIQKLGADHPDVASVYNNIGDAYNRQGKYDDSLSLYNKALNICQRKTRNTFGVEEDDSDVASIYSKIAAVYFVQGKYGNALPFYNKSLNITLRLHGEFHPSVGDVYNNIAALYSEQGKLNDSLEYYDKVLQICIEKFGNDHPRVADVYFNKATVYQQKGGKSAEKEALDCLEKALKINLTKKGENDLSVAKIHNSLGILNNDLLFYDEAMSFFQNSLRIQRLMLGDNHSDVSSTYNNIAGVYHAQGKFSYALTYFEKAFQISMATDGADHPNTVSIMGNIEICKGEIGTDEEGVGIEGGLDLPSSTSSSTSTSTPTSRPMSSKGSSINLILTPPPPSELPLATRPKVELRKMDAYFEKESGGKSGLWQTRLFKCDGDRIAYFRFNGIIKCGEIQLQDATLLESPHDCIYIYDNHCTVGTTVGVGRVFKIRSYDAPMLALWKETLQKALV